MSSRRLLSYVYKTHTLLLLLLALFLGNSYAQTSPNCERPSASCGNIHNISHPFRLKGDPKNCGAEEYELECVHDRLVLNLFFSGKYYVLSINYNNYTIRLVDVGIQQGNCSSLPLYSLSDLNFTNFDAKPYSLLLRSNEDRIYYDSYGIIPWDMAEAVRVDCKKPVKNSPFYTDGNTNYASSCIEKSTSSLWAGEKGHHSYFLFGSVNLSDVADHCKIVEIFMTTLRLPSDKSEAKLSFLDFHSELEYGFELSWLSSRCEKCQRRDDCVIGTDYTATCLRYCLGAPLFKMKSFLCRLELYFHYYVFPWYKVHGLIITGGILGARTTCGMLCLLAFLIYKFRRRHLSMFDNVEGFLQSQDNLMPVEFRNVGEP